MTKSILVSLLVLFSVSALADDFQKKELPGYPLSREALIPVAGFTVKTSYPPGHGGPIRSLLLSFNDDAAKLRPVTLYVSAEEGPDAGLELLKEIAAKHEGMIPVAVTDDAFETYSYNSADHKICWHVVYESLTYKARDAELSGITITGAGQLFLPNTEGPSQH